MSKILYLDTNIFISLVIKRDDKQEECKALFQKIKVNKFKAVTSSLVISEFVWVLGSFYGISRKDISEKLEGILRLRGLKIIGDFQLTKAIEIFENKSVKFIDAMIASVKPIRERKWVVVSFDKDFDKIGTLRKEPNQL